MHSIKILPIFVQINFFTHMKKTNAILLILFLGGSLSIFGCSEKKSERKATEETSSAMNSPGEKASPLRTNEGKIGNTLVKTQYGSPSVRGRVIWGGLEPYGEVWRTGANEATYVEFSDDVMVEGKPLDAGRYSLFTIPRETGPWTVIFNSEWDLEHGHYQYKEENDVLRVDVNPRWTSDLEEELSITIESDGLLVRWERVELPISVK